MMAHDKECETLAWHFLGGSEHPMTVELLAEGIQSFVDEWIAASGDRHPSDCICADCSGAELTADND